MARRRLASPPLGTSHGLGLDEMKLGISQGRRRGGFDGRFRTWRWKQSKRVSGARERNRDAHMTLDLRPRHTSSHEKTMPVQSRTAAATAREVCMRERRAFVQA